MPASPDQHRVTAWPLASYPGLQCIEGLGARLHGPVLSDGSTVLPYVLVCVKILYK